MGQLGTILAPNEGAPRGLDLTARVQVPRACLGHPDGVWVHVPLVLRAGGKAVARVVSDHDEGDEVRLHLPVGFPDGGGLRLRGQGGQQAGGQVGDLLIQVELTEDPRPARRMRVRPAAGSFLTLLWLVVALAVAAVFVALAAG